MSELRTAADYAIEHAGYMAVRAEALLAALHDEATGVPEDDRVSVAECSTMLRSGIHEFRKRAEAARKALAAPVAPIYVFWSDDGEHIRLWTKDKRRAEQFMADTGAKPPAVLCEVPVSAAPTDWPTGNAIKQRLQDAASERPMGHKNLRLEPGDCYRTVLLSDLQELLKHAGVPLKKQIDAKVWAEYRRLYWANWEKQPGAYEALMSFSSKSQLRSSAFMPDAAPESAAPMAGVEPVANEARLNRAAGIVAAQAGQSRQQFVEWLCSGGLVQMALSHFGKSVGREHIASAACWCEPEVDYVDPETGAAVYVHKGTQ